MDDRYYEPDLKAIDKAQEAFSRRLAALLDKHGTDDAFQLPRHAWWHIQTQRAEALARAWGRDPRTRERVRTPRQPSPRSAEKVARDRAQVILGRAQ